MSIIQIVEIDVAHEKSEMDRMPIKRMLFVLIKLVLMKESYNKRLYHYIINSNDS